MSNYSVSGGDTIDPLIKALMASGSIVKAGFYNNLAINSAGNSFREGAATSTNYSGVTSKGFSRNQTGLKRDIPFNETIKRELERLASAISNSGAIPYEAAEDFLYILISIDNLTDMTKIANAVQIPELVNEDILNSPLDIFAIRGLTNVAFLADAVFGLIKTYQKYTDLVSHQQGNVTKDGSLFEIIEKVTGTIGVLSSLSDLTQLAGMSAPANAASATNILGNNLTKMLLGKEIPIGIQANNPNLSSPSLTGKMMFGEAPNGTSLIDMNHLFAKPIAIYSDVMGGTGNSSFSFKNSGSLRQVQSLDDLITKVAFGGNVPQAGTYAADMLERMQANASNLLGAVGSSSVEMSRADNAIPVLSALSDVLHGVNEKIPVINRQLRQNLMKITQEVDGIDNLVKRGIDLNEALQRGLNPNSLPSDPLPINIDIKSVFPIDVFKNGWVDMNNAMNQLSRASGDIQKVVNLLGSLG